LRRYLFSPPSSSTRIVSLRKSKVNFWYSISFPK
jgi:hypothetical protein